jgi:hypothetical protein
MQVYLDGVEYTTTSPTLTDDTIDYTHTAYGIGTRGTGSIYNGTMKFIYFDTATLDLSVSGNRDKFASPTALGADGSGPTGAQPLVCYYGEVADWNTNRGSGGDYTVTGTLT